MTLAPSSTGVRHLVRITDLSPGELEGLLDAAAQAGHGGGGARRGGPGGDLLACLFDGPTARLRAVFASAAHRLGLQPLFLTSAITHIRDGESIADTLRSLSGTASLVALRLPSQASIDEAAAAVAVPVVNAGSSEHDPCRAVADLLTLREHFGSLAGLRIAYLGADRAIPTSLGEAAAMLGMQVVHASPPTPVRHPDVYGRATAPDPEQIDPRAAVRGAHCLYTDAWVSAGDQGRRGGGIWDAATHQVTDELLALADENAVVFHRLPIHRGQEIAADVADGPRSLIWEQAANLLPATVAVLQRLLADSE